MLSETSPPKLSGSTALSLFAYGAFSAFISGPELLHREAMLKVDWPQQCARLVHQELQEQQPRREIVPQIDLSGLMDGLFGDGASSTFGDVIKPVQEVIDLSNSHARQVQEINEERLRRKAEAAGSRCACAITMLTEHRVQLGLYAATGRLVTPTIFKDLSGSLQTSLRSARCNQGG